MVPDIHKSFNSSSQLLHIYRVSYGYSFSHNKLINHKG
jgi:hypothetical protein